MPRPILEIMLPWFIAGAVGIGVVVVVIVIFRKRSK